MLAVIFFALKLVDGIGFRKFTWLLRHVITHDQIPCLHVLVEYYKFQFVIFVFQNYVVFHYLSEDSFILSMLRIHIILIVEGVCRSLSWTKRVFIE